MAKLRRRPSLWIFVFLAIPLAVVGVLIARSAVIAYLEGEGFRALVEGKAGKALGGSVRFEPLQWSGSQAFTPGMRMDGGSRGAFELLELANLRASLDWRAVFAGEWKLSQIEVAGLTGRIQTEPPVAAPPAAPGPGASTEPAGWLPSRFVMERIVVQRVNLDWPGSWPARLRDSQMTITASGNDWQVAGRGGELEIKEWPELRCIEYALRIAPGAVYLNRAELAAGGSGRILATAEFRGDFQSRVEWSALSVTPWLPAGWRPHLEGTARGTANIKSRENGTPDVSGEVTLENGLLQGLDILDRIATFTSSPQFRKLALTRLAGNFTVTGGNWKFSDVICESRGLLRAEGKLAIAENREVTGILQVGVGPQVLQWIPGSRERVFTRNADGYVWTDVRIGGTIDDLKEDLSARLMLAAQEEVITRSVETLQSAPEAAREGAKSALDILAPLLR